MLISVLQEVIVPLLFVVILKPLPVMNTITIQTADGKELLFNKEGAEVNEPDGLIIGDMLRVYYDGTIHGTDTEGVTVTKIEKIS